MIRPLLFTVLLAAMGLMAADCAPTGPQASSSPSVATAGPACAGAPSSGQSTLAHTCRGGDEPENHTFYRDRVDGGDNPLTPGCHRVHSEASCEDEGRNFSGDYCLDRDLLVEYTDTSCHAHQGAGDKREYSCRAYCRRIGRRNGSCATVHDVCPTLLSGDSAHCVCDGRPRA